jgi:hypothetical protein
VRDKPSADGLEWTMGVDGVGAVCRTCGENEEAPWQASSDTNTTLCASPTASFPRFSWRARCAETRQRGLLCRHGRLGELGDCLLPTAIIVRYHVEAGFRHAACQLHPPVPRELRGVVASRRASPVACSEGIH